MELTDWITPGVTVIAALVGGLLSGPLGHYIAKRGEAKNEQRQWTRDQRRPLYVATRSAFQAAMLNVTLYGLIGDGGEDAEQRRLDRTQSLNDLATAVDAMKEHASDEANVQADLMLKMLLKGMGKVSGMNPTEVLTLNSVLGEELQKFRDIARRDLLLL